MLVQGRCRHSFAYRRDRPFEFDSKGGRASLRFTASIERKCDHPFEFDSEGGHAPSRFVGA